MKPKPKKRYRLKITPRVEELKRQWSSLSFRQRVAASSGRAVLLPPGSVGEHILKPFQYPSKQRPHVLLAASRAVKRQLRALRLKQEKKEKKREKKEKKKRSDELKWSLFTQRTRQTTRRSRGSRTRSPRIGRWRR